LNIIVIQGPPASGKTRYAERFAKHFGVNEIIDDDRRMHDREFPASSAIILTQYSREAILTWRQKRSRRRQVPLTAIRFVPIADALRAIGVMPAGARR